MKTPTACEAVHIGSHSVAVSAFCPRLGWCVWDFRSREFELHEVVLGSASVADVVLGLQSWGCTVPLSLLSAGV